MRYPRLLIAGTHSGVGKTTVTVALLATFHAKGRRVQPFKVGPDFIDPGHHHAACGRESLNLDTWILRPEMNQQCFLHAAHDADLSIIEGMMGLFDGSSSVTDEGSTLQLAKQLQVPILLVVDGSGLARSAAALVHGYSTFDPQLQVKAVLFNRITSDGHFQLLKAAVEQNTDVSVVGYLRPDPALTIPDRHLGLQTAIERKNHDLYEKLGQSLSETVDLNLLEHIAQSCGDLICEGAITTHHTPPKTTRPLAIGVAYDPAFCFYYRDNLDLLETAGAELVRFSPIDDATVPEVDLLYLGGGYPEVYAQQLERNSALRKAVRDFAASGRPIYAECGGLMFLTSALIDCEGRSYEMVGIFPAAVTMNRTFTAMGYRTVSITESCLIGEKGEQLRGHEFHYSSLIPQGDLHYIGTRTDANGGRCGQDGMARERVVAFYTHLHFKSRPSIAWALINAAKQTKFQQ